MEMPPFIWMVFTRKNIEKQTWWFCIAIWVFAEFSKKTSVRLQARPILIASHLRHFWEGLSARLPASNKASSMVYETPPRVGLCREVLFFLGHWNSCNEPSFTSTSFHGTIYKTVGSERWESTHMKNDIRSMSEWMYYSHSNPFWHKLYVSFYDSAHITTFCSTKRLIPSHQQTSPCTWPVACVVSWQVPHGCRRGIPLQILLMRLCLDIYLYWTTKKAWLMIVLSSSHAG